MSRKDYEHTGCEYKNGYMRTCPTCGYLWEHGRSGVHSCIAELKKQLQAAHRAGWEQGKREAVKVMANIRRDEMEYGDIGKAEKAIANMEYREEV